MGMDQNTYENTIFSGMKIHLYTNYFDVNKRGTIGFDTLPNNCVCCVKCEPQGFHQLLQKNQKTIFFGELKLSCSRARGTNSDAIVAHVSLHVSEAVSQSEINQNSSNSDIKVIQPQVHPIAINKWNGF